MLEYCGTRSNVVEYVQLEKKIPHIMIIFTAQIKYVVILIRIPVNTGMYWYVLVCTCSMYWYVLVCTDIYLLVTVIYRYVPVHIIT